MDKQYTTQEIADKLGLSRSSVLQAIYRGQLKAVKRGRDYLINMEDVRKWRKNLKR